jgi:hypothetical protein
LIIPNIQTLDMKKTFAILVIAVCLSACYYDNFEELYPGAGLDDSCDTSGTISFAGKVQPILNQNCGTSQSGCHAPGASGFWDLSGYAGTAAANADGVLLPSIKHEAGAQPMPKVGSGSIKMNDCNIAIIEKWIVQGANNN